MMSVPILVYARQYEEKARSACSAFLQPTKTENHRPLILLHNLMEDEQKVKVKKMKVKVHNLMEDEQKVKVTKMKVKVYNLIMITIEDEQKEKFTLTQ